MTTKRAANSAVRPADGATVSAEGFTIGPSIGTFTSCGGTVYGIDATLLPSKEHWGTWVSAGLGGTSTEHGTRNLPSLEAGEFFFLNLG